MSKMQDLYDLRAEAGAAGDTEMVEIVNLALDGDRRARLECERVLMETHRHDSEVDDATHYRF